MESIPAEKKTTGQKPIIDLRSVTKVYRVGSVDVHALRGIDLQIMPGEFCCIIGRSGSGKSTLLNMLAGLEPVTSGEVVINGKHLERMNQSELILFRQKYVGFIFQSFNLMPYYTALENVAFPLREQKLPVFLVDTALSSNDYDAAFLTNNLEAGAEVCQQMVEQIKANGVKESEEATVLVHVSTLASTTIADRLNSIMANWGKFAPASWKIEHDYIINYGDDAGAAKLVAEKIKNTHNVKGIIACNNGSTNATVEAVMAAGRKDIAVTGFDLGKKTLLGLEDKNYSIAVAVQNQYKMGYEAVMAAAAAAKDGSKPAQKLVNTGIRMVDKNNYKK